MWKLREIRQCAEFLDYFHEIRFEDLCRDETQTLRDLERFLDIRPFDRSSLDQFRSYGASSSIVTGDPTVPAVLVGFLKDLGYHE